MSRKDRLTSLIEQMRDNALGPHRDVLFRGEEIGRLLQRVLTECEEKPQTSRTQTGRAQQAKLTRNKCKCDKCGLAMRWNSTQKRKDGSSLKRYHCLHCGNKKTVEVKI